MGTVLYGDLKSLITAINRHYFDMIESTLNGLEASFFPLHLCSLLSMIHGYILSMSKVASSSPISCCPIERRGWTELEGIRHPMSVCGGQAARRKRPSQRAHDLIKAIHHIWIIEQQHGRCSACTCFRSGLLARIYRNMPEFEKQMTLALRTEDYRGKSAGAMFKHN